MTGALLRDAIISASNSLHNHAGEVDALNVFPVPDGDTGTNMLMTVSAAARKLSLLPDSADVSAVSELIASAMLRGARGNSGVILSMIFRGIANSFVGKSEADGADVSAALAEGTREAYGAVTKPVEGTMLTVIREAAESAVGGSPDEVWTTLCAAAHDALARTTEMLPALRSAGVVDAGGQGLVHILDGMKSVFECGVIIEKERQTHADKPAVAAASFNKSGFIYCTEFLIDFPVPDADALENFRRHISSVGDCAVVVADGEIIKVHVHSNEPDKIICAALRLGELTDIKIENMRRQHSSAHGLEKELPVELKKYGVVAVANGDGISRLFAELSADKVVDGGQSMNPSTDSILRAVNSVPAEHVFILPNNKNIVMAAEQAARLAERSASVIETKTVPQGIAAMLAFDEGADAETNRSEMLSAAEGVHTGLVTFAGRDSSVDGKVIHYGDILGLENGELTVVESDPIKAAYRITRRLCRRTESSPVISIFYGDGTDETRAEELASLIKSRSCNAEISVVNGGQPLYSFMISVE